METELKSELKAILKLLRKIRAHQEDPTGEKAKERATNNGFNRVQEITPELRDFLGLPEGEKISRSDVTKRVTAYISENGLKHPDNGRMIILDNKLMELLKPPEGVQVTFLNIQTYLNPHYIKPPKEKKLTKKQKLSSRLRLHHRRRRHPSLSKPQLKSRLRSLQRRRLSKRRSSPLHSKKFIGV